MNREITHSFSNDVAETFAAIIAFVKCSKIYLAFAALISWVFSTYDIKGILIVFATSTVLDTITRINADARNAKYPFQPFSLQFWMRIKSSGLKKMGRKIFVEYGIAVLLAFTIDTFIFKNTLHFQVSVIKLDIPMCAILFFTCIEIWSIFENIEDSGSVNWLKKGLKWFSSLLPEKWKKVYDDINEDNSKNQNT